MTTADTITARWAAGDRAGALALAVQSRGLDADAARIRRGYNAARSPGFYRVLGFDPDALIADAYAAMARRYGLPL